MQANLVKSPGHPKNTQNNKFAIRYGNTAYIFVVSKKKLKATKVSDENNNKELKVIKTHDGKSYKIIIGDGTGKVVLTTKGGRIDIAIKIQTARYEGESGLCFKKDKKKVPNKDNMFKKNVMIPAENAETLQRCWVDQNPVCGSPDDGEEIEPIEPGCEEVTYEQIEQYSSEVTYDTEVYPTFESIDPVLAEKRCTALITDNYVPQVDRANYIKNCASDYGALGDITCVEAYRLTYNAECGTTKKDQIKMVAIDAVQNDATFYVVASTSGSGGGESSGDDGGSNGGEGGSSGGEGGGDGEMESTCVEEKCGANGYCNGNGQCGCNDGWMGNECQYSEADEIITDSFANSSPSSSAETITALFGGLASAIIVLFV
jgi:hypothetical protein